MSERSLVAEFEGTDMVDKIYEAVQNVLGGYAKKIDVADGVKVYECKNVVRIDLGIKH